MWISGDSVRASPRLSGLWRIVAGHVRMGRSLRMTWEGAITTRLSRGSVDRMRTLGWGSSGRYPVTGPCFLGNKNYESCLGAKCKKECHEAPWTKKYKVNNLYIYIVYNCNNIVEWNSPVISILILHTSKELKHWKKSHLKSGPYFTFCRYLGFFVSVIGFWFFFGNHNKTLFFFLSFLFAVSVITFFCWNYYLGIVFI